jgi:hypothetical protein
MLDLILILWAFCFMTAESLANVCVVRDCQLSRGSVPCNRFDIVELFDELQSC